MSKNILCDSDYRFMQVVWDNAPVGSGELVRLCKEKLGWQKSTTYTTIRKLCEKGFIMNEDARVSVLISREDTEARESAFFVDRSFGGSLPGFVAAFLSGRAVTDEEARRIRKMLDESMAKAQ